MDCRVEASKFMFSASLSKLSLYLVATLTCILLPVIVLLMFNSSMLLPVAVHVVRSDTENGARPTLTLNLSSSKSVSTLPFPTEEQSHLYHTEENPRMNNSRLNQSNLKYPVLMKKKTNWSQLIKKQKKKSTTHHVPITIGPRLENGYVLALDYWDQQTSALRNLLSLQCWAGHFGPRVSVVEPFVIQSRFGALPKTEEERRGQIRFQDLFDITQWKKTSVKHSHHKRLARLASWSEFLSKAPRPVILVTIGYARLGFNCTQALDKHLNEKDYSNFLNTHKFQVVRTVCVDIQKMTTRQFDEKLFGNLSLLHSATIIFKQWRGVQDDRISLTDSVCDNGMGFSHVGLNLRTSSKVINDMKKYIHTYFGKEQVYTALVVRLEKVIINSIDGQSLNNVKVCLGKVIEQWSRLRRSMHFPSTFLAIDYGKFGTAGFLSPLVNTSGIAESVEKFVTRIFGEEMTISKWDQMFENVTNVTNAGYIALMQSSIAARSKCIVLAGGGLFQAHTLQLYKQIPRSKQCYMRFDEKCHLTDSKVVIKS